MTIKPKGLIQFLEEDPTLTEKFTYEEYLNGKAAPQNKDVTVEEAYTVYCEKRNRLVTGAVS